MALGCGASVAKVVLIVVNTIFLLLGLGIGIAGLVFRFGTDLFEDKIKDALKELKVEVVGGINIYDFASSISLLLIIVGFFIFIVGALGCCGACCQNRVLLVVYGIIVALLLIAQIVGVALFAGFRSSFDDTFKEGFITVIKEKYNVTEYEDFSHSMDALFEAYKCCGVDTYKDLTDNGKPLPNQCCPTGPCKDTSPASDDYPYQGCYTKLKDQIEKYNNVFIGVGVSVLVFQLLCVILAFCLCVAVGRDNIV